MAVDPLRKAHADGQRLREAIDTEYRAARRDGSWGRAEPQIVERWRAAVRAWTLAVEAALGPEAATLGRFRGAPPATETRPARARRGSSCATRWRARWPRSRAAGGAGKRRTGSGRGPAAEPVPQALRAPAAAQAGARVENTVIG